MSSTAPQRRARYAPPLSGASLDRARLAVVPRLRSRAPRVPFVMLVSMLLLTGVVGLLLFNTSMQQASFTASRLEDQAAVLAAREQALTTQLEEQRSPVRLKRLGCAKGMVIGSSTTSIDLRTGRITGTPTPATKADSPCGANLAGTGTGQR